MQASARRLVAIRRRTQNPDIPRTENLTKFDFGEFPYHPLETNTPTILHDPINKNPVDLSQVSVAARQLACLYVCTVQEIFHLGACR
jgi:hypothetical protein